MSRPDINTGLVFCLQNGGLNDLTMRGNDLTASHTDPAAATAWSVDTLYAQGVLVTESGVTYYARTENSGQRPSEDVSFSTWYLWRWNEEVSYLIGDLALDGIVYRAIQKNRGTGTPSTDFDNWIVNAPQTVSTGLTNLPFAMQFNGVDNYLSRGSTTDLQLGGTDFTILLWASVKNKASGQDIFAKSSEYGLFVTDGPATHFQASDVIGTNTSIDDGFFHHVVIRKFGSAWALFVDAILQDDTSQITITNASGDFSVGKLETWGYSNCLVAQLLLWKRALSQGQINYVFNDGNGKLISFPPPAFQGTFLSMFNE